MTTRLPILCDSCIHRGPSGYPDNRPLCNAFPTGVPVEITNMEFDHREPHPLDNGINYDMEPGKENILDSHLETRGLLQLLTEGE